MKKMVLLFVALASATACASTPTSPTSTPRTTPAATPAASSRGELASLPHERVEYHVNRFGGEKRAEFESYLERMRQYEEMIRGKLRRRGMPEDLIYLALIESGFNPEIRSLAEARGIWQLIPDTARRYGLRVDETVDERNDPEKSTDAALSYLSYLYNRFDSWYLAIAAYNTGENRIGRIMTEVTGSEKGTDADYYRIWDRLPGETRDFVPVIVAAARLGNAAR